MITKQIKIKMDRRNRIEPINEEMVIGIDGRRYKSRVNGVSMAFEKPKKYKRLTYNQWWIQNFFTREHIICNFSKLIINYIL